MTQRFGLRRAGAVLAASSLLAVGLPVGLAAAPAHAVSPDLVISEVYGGGGNSGAIYTNDFVELFNRGAAAVSLAGMSIQYASASGTGPFAPVTLNGTVAPGQRHLVSLSGGATGSPLPTADTTGVLNMSGTSGKVALAEGTASLGCNGGSTPCDPTQLARIVDLVGYGAANFFEGAAAPGLSNSTAALRAEGGCTDTDDNSADFTAGAPDPQNSASPLTPCGGGPGDQPPLTQCPASLIAPVDEGASAAVSATDDNDGIGSIAITSAPVDGVTLENIDLAAGSAVLTVAPTTASGDYDVTVEFATDAATPQTATCTVAVTVEAPPEPALISQIQGSGPASPLVGQDRVVEAVVTAVKPGISGFYLQEEVSDSDNNPATSEGIFVFGRSTVGLVEVGDLVRVTGSVGEFTSTTGAGSSQTQLSDATVEVVDEDVPVPTPTAVTFPVESTTYLERFEGMLVELVDELVISEYFNYDRFGEVVLGKPLEGQDRLFTPTAVVDPGAEAQALAAEQALRIITLDDYFSGQNPTSIPHPGNGDPFSATNSFRGGDTVTGVVGVIDHTFGLYRIQPTEYGDYEAVNPRPADAPEVGGRIQVASFNVLNYFLTLDQSGNRCGPLLNLDCRGANSQAELDRQRVKIVEAIAELDADVVGLMEMENSSGVEPAADLVDGLNDLVGAGTYAFIDTGVIGTDAIRLGFLYKPGAVQPAGDYAILDSSVDSRFIDTANRPMLTQTFDEVATGERVSVSVNHLKSKGSACSGDPDTGDGQGNCNQTRTAAAEAIADFLAGDPTDSGDPDHLVIGDLNSYDHEDPIQALEDAGYTDLVRLFGGEFAYGYVFDGKVGYLDHALSNEALTPQVTGASEWHINADEPDILDYNLDFGRPSTFFSPDPYRSSDHDPVRVGLALGDPVAVVADLRVTLADMGIQRGISNALDVKLRDAQKAMATGDTAGACDSLQSFIDQVNAQSGKKISQADAQILIKEAVSARVMLGC